MCRTAVSGARLLVRCGTDNTEALAVVLVAGVVAVPAGNLAVVVAVAAIAAATVIAAAIAAVRVDIPAPLPNIAAHVVESVAVCLFLCH